MRPAATSTKFSFRAAQRARSGGLRPRGPPSPSLAGPREPRSAPAGAPVARLAPYSTSRHEDNVRVSSRITGHPNPGGFAPQHPLRPPPPALADPAPLLADRLSRP